MAMKFLYLSEPDTIEAGVLDAARCVEVSSEVFQLLAEGDYLMGGSSHNAHGLGLIFPKSSPFPNMPTAGPDRRFVAMPAYVGGRFDVCGEKWYGSNAENKQKGLPRSILTVMLNDRETGAPLSLMSANLLSAARTGAIPGVGVKYLARKDAKIMAVIGCGSINEACVDAILTQAHGLEKIICHNHSRQRAEQLAEKIHTTYGIEAVVDCNLESSLKTADIISIAASRTAPLYIKDAWIKKGALILASGPLQCEESLWLSLKIVYDHIGLHHNYVSEAIASDNKEAYYDSVIGGPIYRLIDSGKLPALDDSLNIGDIILKKQIARLNEDDRIIFIACGMAPFDVAWAYELYQNALKLGIGTQLALWDQPYQMK